MRNFILTNIERNTDYHWRVNIDAIEANLDTLTQFPHIDTHYSGPTLFIAGSRSEHVTYVLSDAVCGCFMQGACMCCDVEIFQIP